MSPKPVPLIITVVPTAPNVGLRPVILGLDGETVKLTPLLGVTPTVTTTFPVVAPPGTNVERLVSLQLATNAATGAPMPLKVTLLEPCEAPKPVPVMVTTELTPPEEGLKAEMTGFAWVMVIVAVPDLVGSALEVAVRVTVGGVGAVGGAVYELI